MNCLELTSVSKGYGRNGSRTEVLSDINLTLAPGEFVAIIGYSGTGKTTLVSLLAGLIKPDRGTLLFDGIPAPEAGPERGLVFQNYSLLPWMNVTQNVALSVDEIFSGESAEQRKERVRVALATVNLTPAALKYPRELSGGMRQRVSLARTLAMNPEVLILDEPLGALDALTRGVLQEEISRIWQEDQKTVVLVTNDPDEAILLADRVIPLLPCAGGATLGESMRIDLPRPRDRKEVTTLPEFKKLRHDLMATLLDAKAKRANKHQVKLILPNIEPEDISITSSRTLFGVKRKPVRKNERQTITVESA